MTVRIRQAVAADAATIHEMILAIAAATGDADKVRSSAADIAAHGFGARPAFTVLLVERDGRPVGMSLWFSSFSTWRGEPGGYIQDFYVSPDARGGEVARRLMAATALAIHDQGGTYVRLSVDAGNTRAQRFYAREGFRWSEGEQLFVLDAREFADYAANDVRDR